MEDALDAVGLPVEPGGWREDPRSTAGFDPGARRFNRGGRGGGDRGATGGARGEGFRSERRHPRRTQGEGRRAHGRRRRRVATERGGGRRVRSAEGERTGASGARDPRSSRRSRVDARAADGLRVCSVSSASASRCATLGMRIFHHRPSKRRVPHSSRRHSPRARARVTRASVGAMRAAVAPAWRPPRARVVVDVVSDDVRARRSSRRRRPA